jgi:hypothetical protein
LFSRFFFPGFGVLEKKGHFFRKKRYRRQFFEGTRAEIDTTLENCWYGRVVLLFRIRVKTDEKDRNGRSVLMDCDCAMIDCLHDYAPGR